QPIHAKLVQTCVELFLEYVGDPHLSKVRLVHLSLCVTTAGVVFPKLLSRKQILDPLLYERWTSFYDPSQKKFDGYEDEPYQLVVSIILVVTLPLPKQFPLDHRFIDLPLLNHHYIKYSPASIVQR